MSDLAQGGPLGPGRVETRELEQEMRSSFLDYAMSVIVSRALPDVRDGLKPVHRRLLYGMHEAGMQPNRPYKKCAKIVGDVMGTYHPHGDQSLYDTLVRMAQPFSLRYPLVDGQGNFGNLDDDPAAAMRYTECRLARIATEMLRDIHSDTVDFKPNYDESTREPEVLPARFPNLLVNGSAGIAVGMATNMPPHRLDEVTAAIVELIDKPEANVDDLMRHVKGPDFPTGAIVVGQGRHPRRVPHRARPHRHARARPHRGAARREDGDHRHRAPLRGQEGRRVRRDHEDRRALQGEGPHRDLRRRGLLGQVRDADPDRPQARGDPAGRPEQALQAHVAPDDLRLQRGRARRRRTADALAARARHALPRLPARDRRPPLEVRAAQGGGARPRPPGVPDRARQPRRGDRPDPRLGRHGRGTHRTDGVVRSLRGAGAGDPRPPSRAPHGARAEGDRGRVRRPPGADRRAPRHPRRPGSRRRGHPRGAPRAEGDLRPHRRPADGDHRRRGRVRARGHDRGGGHGHRDHSVGLHQAPTGDHLPRAAPRRDRRDGHGDEGRGLHRAPLRRLDARLHPLLHDRRQGLPAQGARAAARLPAVEGSRDRQPPAAPSGRGDPRGDRDPQLRGGEVPRLRDEEGRRSRRPRSSSTTRRSRPTGSSRSRCARRTS